MLADSVLHLVVSEGAANWIREGLRPFGRQDGIEHFDDDLTVGPIHDVDRGAASRAAWWRHVDNGKVWPTPRALDDAETWKRVVHDERDVVLWYAPHPNEYIYALRACWFLRRNSSRVYEVRLPANSNPRLQPFYGAVGIIGPKGVAAAWPSVRRIRNVGARAQRWVDLRAQRDDGFRELRGARIVERAITIHDEVLVSACADAWTASGLVLARVLSQVPTGTAVLSWRVRELLASGALEGRGRKTEFDLPKELHRAVKKQPERRASPMRRP